MLEAHPTQLTNTYTLAGVIANAPGRGGAGFDTKTGGVRTPAWGGLGLNVLARRGNEII